MSDLDRRSLFGLVLGLLAAAVPAQARRWPRGRKETPASGGTAITTFSIVETDSATSLGYKRIGLIFGDGDVPVGQRVFLQRGGSAIAAQFDNRSYYPSGALRICTCCLRDSNFSAGESRLYSVMRETGAFDNTSAATLADVTGASDFTVEFTSRTGSLSGPMANVTASFDTHAAVSTRVTKYESGSVCDSWMVWGMAGADAHLKTNWYVTRWKDGGGSLVAFEVCAVVAMDWWSVAAKQKQTYTATLKDGATTIQAYAAVEHIYHAAALATVRMTSDNQHATRHWRGATRPTLVYQPNRAYWVSTGMVPPLDLSDSYTMPGYTNTYVPGSKLSHREFIDETGGYAGRGVITNMDSIALWSQTAADYRVARVNAFYALNLPYHYRSNHTRTRPSESADTANTACALILWDERGSGTPSSFYDFTADGMPAAVHAYCDRGQATPRTDVLEQDGWVIPHGGMVSGSTTWTLSSDTSHAVLPCYFAYLLEGERYFLDAMIDLGQNAIQQQVTGVVALLGFPGAPSTEWAGVGLFYFENTRAVGWAANLISAMAAVIPAADVHSNYLQQVAAVNAKYADNTVDYEPGPNNPGVWCYQTVQLLWHDAFISMGAYAAYQRLKDTNWKTAAEFTAGPSILFASTGYIGLAQGYTHVTRKSGGDWNAVTNPWFSPASPRWLFPGNATASISSITDRVTMDSYGYTWANDDRMTPFNYYELGGSASVPAELTLGTEYYVVNVSGDTFQLSLTSGGAPINFASNVSPVAFGVRKAEFQTTPSVNPEDMDSYAPIHRAVIVNALRNSHPGATSGQLASYDALIANFTGGAAWANWTLTT